MIRYSCMDLTFVWLVFEAARVSHLWRHFSHCETYSDPRDECRSLSFDFYALFIYWWIPYLLAALDHTIQSAIMHANGRSCTFRHLCLSRSAVSVATPQVVSLFESLFWLASFWSLLCTLELHNIIVAVVCTRRPNSSVAHVSGL